MVGSSLTGLTLGLVTPVPIAVAAPHASVASLKELHRVIVFEKPLSLTRVANLLEVAPSPVIAIDHSSPYRGGIYSENGMDPHVAVDSMRTRLQESGIPQQDVSIFSIRVVADDRLTAALQESRLEVASSSLVTPAETTIVVPSDERLPAIRAFSASSVGEQSSTSRQGEFVEAFAPSVGTVDAYETASGLPPLQLTRGVDVAHAA